MECEMTKIVYYACYGSFSISRDIYDRYWELKGTPPTEDYNYYSFEDRRDDPLFAQAVEELGVQANEGFSCLQIRELPAGTLYRIDEYDGLETVMTQDEYTWSVA
jgi:hypothetical protein